MKKGNFFWDDNDGVEFIPDDNGKWVMADPPIVGVDIGACGPVAITIGPNFNYSAVKIDKSELTKMIWNFIKGLRREPKFIKIRKLENNPTILFRKK